MTTLRELKPGDPCVVVGWRWQDKQPVFRARKVTKVGRLYITTDTDLKFFITTGRNPYGDQRLFVSEQAYADHLESKRLADLVQRALCEDIPLDVMQKVATLLGVELTSPRKA